jgi:TetR/AcrR family transcriptional repressor of bet genes
MMAQPFEVCKNSDPSDAVSRERRAIYRSESVSTPVTATGRTASPETRRRQLIDATVKTIAEQGIAGVTMARVTQTAGLSIGIVNLHFQSKERLLEETLRSLASEYRTAWEHALENAGEDACARLEALVTLDFDAAIAHRDKLAVWFAFWGEAKSRPTYRQICAKLDKEYDRALEALCSDIGSDGYDIPPRVVVESISALITGLWLDMLISPRSMTRQEGHNIVMRYLGSVYDRHFPRH